MQSARAERATKRARRESDAQFSRKVSTVVPRPLRKRPAMEALPTPGALRPRSRPFVSAAKRARRQQRNTGAGVVRERPAPGACAKPGVPPFAIGGATTTTSARAERAAERARRRRKPGAQVPREVPTGMPGPQASRKRPAPGALQAPEPPRQRGRPFGGGSGNPRSQDPPQGSQGSSRSNHAAPPRSGAGNPRSRHRAPPPQGDGSGGECMPSAHGTPPPADAVSPRSRGSSQDLQGSPRNRRAGCEFTIDDARSRDHGCQSPGNTISRRQGTNRAGGRRRERAARRSL